MSAGYSGKPLVEKLGLKAGMRIALLNTPDDYDSLIGRLPPGVTVNNALEEPCDFIHIFTTERQALEGAFPRLLLALATDGMLWVSWAKRAANVPTDLDENIIREMGLAHGLVDVKVAAVDATWSALKFVRRLKDRD